MPELSIILPCYNEAPGIPSLLARYAEVLAGLDAELVLVDNGSRDQTPAVLAAELPKFPFAHSIRVEPNQGYGHGIASGLATATGEWLAWSHADLQTDPGDVVTAYRRLRSLPDAQRTLVKGHRSGRRLSEQVITTGMQVAALFCLRRWIPEINAQPKVFHRSLLAQVSRPPVDFNFDVYVLVRALRAGWRLETIPVRFPPRQHGQSNWSATFRSRWRTIRRSFWFMFRLGHGGWE